MTFSLVDQILDGVGDLVLVAPDGLIWRIDSKTEDERRNPPTIARLEGGSFGFSIHLTILSPSSWATESPDRRLP
jgi:hypothetical protein